MDCNFLLSSMSCKFYYVTLSVTWCVRVVSNFSQMIDFSLGMTFQPGLPPCTAWPAQPSHPLLLFKILHLNQLYHLHCVFLSKCCRLQPLLSLPPLKLPPFLPINLNLLLLLPTCLSSPMPGTPLLCHQTAQTHHPHRLLLYQVTRHHLVKWWPTRIPPPQVQPYLASLLQIQHLVSNESNRAG